MISKVSSSLLGGEKRFSLLSCFSFFELERYSIIFLIRNASYATFLSISDSAPLSYAPELKRSYAMCN